MFPRCRKPSCASLTIFSALALHFFLSISLPFLTPWYLVETSFNNNNNTKESVAIGSYQPLVRIRLGIWGDCYYSLNNSTCSKASPAYHVTVKHGKSLTTVVEPLWTGGLPVQVFATGFTLIAGLFTHFLHINSRFATLVTVGLAGLASILTMFIEVALFGFVKSKMNTLGPGAGATTIIGPGFWVTLFSILLLITGFFTILCTKPENINQSVEKGRGDHIEHDSSSESDANHHPLTPQTDNLASQADAPPLQRQALQTGVTMPDDGARQTVGIGYASPPDHNLLSSPDNLLSPPDNRPPPPYST